MIGGSREIKVGLFVFIALVLLTVVVFSISDLYQVQPRYTYPLRVRFQFANGVEEGAPVRLAGVKAGEVREVRVYRDEATQRTHAELGVRLVKEAKVEEDSVVYINTLGIVGEKYVEIVPGSPGSRLLGPNEVLLGKDSIPSEKLVESGYKAIEQLGEAVRAVNAVMGDEVTQDALKETFSNSKEATAQLTAFLAQANEVMGKVRNGEGTIGKLLTQDELYKDLQAIVADIKAHPWKLLYRPKEKKK